MRMNILTKERKRTMKKLLCVALTILLMTACAAGLAVDIVTEDIPSNYGLIFDGNPIQLPIPASDLMDKGWELSFLQEDATLPAMTYDTGSLAKGNSSFMAYFVNTADVEKPLGECSIAGLMLFKADNIPFTMNNGVSFTSTCEEVCAAYGLNKDEIAAEYAEGSQGFSVSFYASDNGGIHTDKGISSVAVGMNQIDFNFDKPLTENGVLESIMVRYMDGAK